MTEDTPRPLMADEKYFIVETYSRFKIQYLVRATDLTQGDAQELVDSGMLNEIHQDFVDEEVHAVDVCTPELLLELNLPIDTNDVPGDQI